MKLNYNMVFGRFIERKNRFIADVEINGNIESVHVMNTGRLGELLIKGAEVMLSYEALRARKTAYDLRMVKKDGLWISIDSQLPNRITEEGIKLGLIEELKDYKEVFRESVYKKSRFDFKLVGDDICLMEVKGVTLERNGWGYFPDAPTERGRKHIEEMMLAVEEGFRGVILFVIQHPSINGFSPNIDMDPQFSNMLVKAKTQGVEVLAYKCHVNLEEVKIQKKIPVMLGK